MSMMITVMIILLITISARRPDLIIINKKKRICKIVDFAVLADQRMNLKESEKKYKYLDLARESKKTMEHESDDCTNCDWCFWHSNYRIIKGRGGFGSWRPSGDHPNDSIAENAENTEKSPGDLRRLAVTQTPVKDHQLTLMWKTLIIVIIIFWEFFTPVVLFLFWLLKHNSSVCSCDEKQWKLQLKLIKNSLKLSNGTCIHLRHVSSEDDIFCYLFLFFDL